MPGEPRRRWTAAVRLPVAARASDGTGCGDITSATDKTYTPVSGDVLHTLRVVVTATNADGKAAASSEPTDVVASKNGPASTVKPAVTGQALVGEQLTVSNGSWSPAPTSFARQWQRCDADGTGCLTIDGATGRSYGVRSADVGHRLRALVTARTASGSAAVASNATALVQGPDDDGDDHDDVDDDRPGEQGARDPSHVIAAHRRPCLRAVPGLRRPHGPGHRHRT
jgi:hypothetical protein